MTDDTSTNGRDRCGRFAPGNRLAPGRTPRPDYAALVRQHAEAAGVDIDRAVWEVTETLIRLAKAGDVAAAKLLLDRLTAVEPHRLEVGGIDPELMRGPPIPDTRTLAQQMIEVAKLCNEVLAPLDVDPQQVTR